VSLLDAIHGGYVHRHRVKVLRGQLSAMIPHQSIVLDLGCGDGLLARALLDSRLDLSVRGMDVMPRSESLIPVEFFNGHRIPLADDSVDIVMIVDVLHHTKDPLVLLAEAARVAKRSVLLKDHLCQGIFAASTLRFMDWIGNCRHGVSLPYNYLTREQWLAAFRSAQLTVDLWDGHLGLYPIPARWWFDRSLHFIARLVPERLKHTIN
jgi:SAM-dependent methyltransferase